MAESHELVRLFDEDDDLLRGTPLAAAATLRETVSVRALHLRHGAFRERVPTNDDDLGWLILDGCLVRRVTVFGRSSSELLGTGDVLRPSRDDGGLSVLPVTTSLRPLTGTTVAVLDEQFARAVARVPQVGVRLAERLARRSHSMAVRLAIAQMPRLADRLHSFLWHLADRWGSTEGGGVTIDVRLSHGVLAELVSAQRPSVSVALHELQAAGAITRLASGGWRLVGHAHPPLVKGEIIGAEAVQPGSGDPERGSPHNLRPEGRTRP
jgi:CRP-like cAMP-binding protein